MEEPNKLNVDKLNDVSGGAGTSSNEATYVNFSFDYSAGESRWSIKKYIQARLRERGVPEDVVNSVPVMNPEKSYVSYGKGGMRVEWQKGWDKPKFYKTHD